MKKLLLCVGITIVALMGIGANCTPREAVKNVLDVSQALCVVAHAELSDPEVAKLCSIEQALYPAIQALLAESRVNMEKAAAAARAKVAAEREVACSPYRVDGKDAGAAPPAPPANPGSRDGGKGAGQ